MDPCPSQETLARLGTASTEATDFTLVEAHVEGCAQCQAILERLVGHDTEAEPGPGPSSRRRPVPAIPGFLLSAVLGQGSTGVVFRARETNLEREVAIKFVGRGPADDDRGRKRWIREAQAVARVEHANVVPIHQVGEQDGWLYLVLKLIPGGSVRDRLAGPLAADVAARLVEAVARGVDVIHQAGLLHLDIKPSNILLDGPPDGPWDAMVPLIADFGLARFQDDPGATASEPDRAWGTPWYMSPEQAACDRTAIGPAADVYALGATLYHLLTGRPPFQAPTILATLDQVRHREPVAPRALIPALSRDLETICLACLHKDPNRRYETARALADDLRCYLDDRPITARPLSKPEIAWRWCRRHPAVAGLSAALVLTLFAGVSTLLVLLDRARTEQARAAVERRHAENYAQFTARAADDLVDLINRAVLESTTRSRDQVVATLAKLRDSANEVRRRGTIPPGTLGKLEMQIGWGFYYFGKIPEAKPLLQNAVTDLTEGLRANPNDPGLKSSLADALFHRGRASAWAGDRKSAMDDQDRIIEMLLNNKNDIQDLKGYLDLCVSFREDAEYFERRNEAEGKQRALNVYDQIIRHLGTASYGAPPTATVEAPEHARGRSIDTAIDQLLHFIEHLKSDQTGNRLYHSSATCLVALSVDPFGKARPNSCAAAEGNLDVWARMVVASIRQRCSSPALGDSAVPSVAAVLSGFASRRAADERKLGRLADAQRTAKLLMAFARQVLREYPDRADSYLVLSEAQMQIGKNAWPHNDYPTIERWYEESLASARHALQRDSGHQAARLRAVSLEERLVGVRALAKRVPPTPVASH